MIKSQLLFRMSGVLSRLELLLQDGTPVGTSWILLFSHVRSDRRE